VSRLPLLGLAAAGLLTLVVVAPVGVASAMDEPPPWLPPRQEGDGVRCTFRGAEADLRAAIAERSRYEGIELDFAPASADQPASLLLACRGESIYVYGSRVDALGELMSMLEIRKRLGALTDAALASAYDGEACDWARETLLAEIARRGSVEWIPRLRAWEARDVGGSVGSPQLEALTVLRRLEGRPDPLRVHVMPPDPTVFPGMPRVRVTIRNDSRGVVLLREGCEKNGIDSSFFVEVRDAEGRLMPSDPVNPEFYTASSGPRPLPPDESSDVLLRTHWYVSDLPPGEYVARVHYHNRGHIQGLEAPLNRITFVSDPFPIRIDPLVIETSWKQRSRVRALSRDLPTEGPVCLLDEPYGAWAHRIIPPNSGIAELIGMGWPAIPPLVRFASDPSSDPVRRAFALFVIYEISRFHKPPPSVELYGGYRTYRRDHRSRARQWSGFARKHDARIDVDAQLDLVRAWERFLKRCDVRLK